MIERGDGGAEDTGMTDRRMARMCLRAAMQALDDADGQDDAERWGGERQEESSGDSNEERH